MLPRVHLLHLRMPRHRPLIVLSLTLLLGIILYISHFYRTHELPPSHHLHNGALQYSPTWSHPYLGSIFPDPNGDSNFDPPTIFPDLIAAPALDTWITPQLSSDPHGTALLFLHVFSTGTPAARHRRELIRAHPIISHIDPSYRHLVEMRFVLGYPDPEKAGREDEEARNVLAEEAENAVEMQRHGDVIRLPGLLWGDNMNRGKSWEWIRWVGNQSAREAQWVLKCDDDTLPILPNLLDLLLSLDPGDPTYIGSALGRWTGFHYYFTGMMYGMTWSVIKTIAEADVPKFDIQYDWHEDARIGALMYSLPTASDCLSHHATNTCDPHTPPPGGWTAFPRSPDPRTGLTRYGVGHRLGDYHQWWIAGKERAIGWHHLKEDEQYLHAYVEVDSHVVKKYGPRGWVPPAKWRHLAALPMVDLSGAQGSGETMPVNENEPEVPTPDVDVEDGRGAALDGDDVGDLFDPEPRAKKNAPRASVPSDWRLPPAARVWASLLYEATAQVV